MNSVLISSESRYPVNRRQIKEAVLQYLKRLEIEDAEVSIAIVGSRKIEDLNRKWRNLSEPTTVLTFALEEPRDINGILHLGDIVIAYPEARLIAQEDNLSMDEAIDKLLLHGLNNLLGSYRDDHSLSQTSTADLSGVGR
jgi:probable rRNA maturation factor